VPAKGQSLVATLFVGTRAFSSAATSQSPATLEHQVVIVGGGAAGLAGTLYFSNGTQ